MLVNNIMKNRVWFCFIVGKNKCRHSISQCEFYNESTVERCLSGIIGT